MPGFASSSLIVDNQVELNLVSCTFLLKTSACAQETHDCRDCQGKITQFYDIDKKKIGEGSYGSVCKARNKAAAVNFHPAELTVTMDAVQATKAMRAIKTINKAALKSCKLGFTLHIPHAASCIFHGGSPRS